MTIKYVYHWCATWRRENGVAVRDGIVTLDQPIASHDDLLEVHQAIADDTGAPAADMVLTSLTLLHTLYPEAAEVIHGQ